MKQPRVVPSQPVPPRPPAAAAPSPAQHEPTTDGEPCACCSVGLPMMYQAGPSGWLRNKPGSSGTQLAKHWFCFCFCLRLCLCLCLCLCLRPYPGPCLCVCLWVCLCLYLCLCLCVSVSLCGMRIGQSLWRCLMPLSPACCVTTSVGVLPVVHRSESTR